MGRAGRSAAVPRARRRATGWPQAGHRVLVVEKKRFPREKTCGDGLTPRAVRQLHDMGLAEPLAGSLRYDGLRSIAHGVTLELAWPEHPDFPAYGYVVRRRDLDKMVADRGRGGRRRRSGRAPRRSSRSSRAASSPGRWSDRDGTAPRPVRARYVVVADGANSRFGRALGAARDRTYPLGMAVRGYFTSPFHDEPWIESHLDLRDRDGNHLPGYGWIFPVGDGTVNVGVGLLSTFAGWKSVNTSKLMDAFVATAPARWGISPDDVVRPAHGREAAHRRVGDAQHRAHLAGRRRRRRFGEPVQRRGHLARVRDRAARRRRGVEPRSRRATAWPCSATPSSSRRCTASTGRWRARSCGPSATRR